MHSKVSLPIHNRYRCRQCQRVYLVPWAERPEVEVSAGPAPESAPRHALQNFLGLIRAAFVARPQLPGHMGTASDGD